MAQRPVFVAQSTFPYVSVLNLDFEWNGGFAKSQKQKNIKALHDIFTAFYPAMKVLEISSKSMQEHGNDLSAFFLQKQVPSLGKSVCVECVFQGSKVFEKGGPYVDLLDVSSREAKGDPRLQNSGPLRSFRFEGKDYPLNPRTIFYNYIYINALLENPALAEAVLAYDAFTDIEFNPDRSINCQAKAAATFVALSRLGLLEEVKDFDRFLALFHGEPPKAAVREEKPQEPVRPKTEIHVGDTIVHKVYGKGTVTELCETRLRIDFPGVGSKLLGSDWCLANCTVEPGAAVKED